MQAVKAQVMGTTERRWTSLRALGGHQSTFNNRRARSDVFLKTTDPVRRKAQWQRNPLRAKFSANLKIKIPRLGRRWGSRKDTGKERERPAECCLGLGEAAWGRQKGRRGQTPRAVRLRDLGEAGGEILRGRALGSRPRSLYLCGRDECA